jgi:hypothetical protein
MDLVLSCLQKIIVAFMIVSQGVVTNFMDHCIKIGESTVIVLEDLSELLSMCLDVSTYVSKQP